MNCTSCGAPLSEGTKFCVSCGAKQPESAPVYVEATAVQTTEAAPEPVPVQPAPVQAAPIPAPAPVPVPAPIPAPAPVYQAPPQPPAPVPPPVYQQQPQYQQPQYQQAPQPQVIPENKPGSLGAFFGLIFLFGLPVIGLIMCILFATCITKNKSIKNFARAYLIWTLIGIVLAIIAFFIVKSIIDGLYSIFNNLLSEYSGFNIEDYIQNGSLDGLLDSSLANTLRAVTGFRF